MLSLRSLRILPIFLRGPELTDPWIYPWFAMAALFIGAPATIERTVGLWLALASGIVMVIILMLIVRFTIYRHSYRSPSSLIAIVSLSAATASGAILTKLLTPFDSMSQFALTTSLALIWLMLWLLTSILVNGQRAYRKDRKSLRVTRTRIELAARDFKILVEEPSQDAVYRLIAELRKLAEHIRESASGQSNPTRESLLESLTRGRDELVSPALEKIVSLNFDNDRLALNSAQLEPVGRLKLEGIPFRWKGKYFSGFVGGLIIGVVALSASANADFANPGFLIQIPLIVLAFSISVPAALTLFFAAALTPFLAPNNAAPENYALFVVIALLAFVSFFHRANEVRQTRILEGLSVANADLAFETVRLQQQTKEIKSKLVSIIHGQLQSSIVAGILSVRSKKVSTIEDAIKSVAILNQAADQIECLLRDAKQTASIDFATALKQIVDFWADELNLSVSVTSQAGEILESNRNARAAVIEVISEATLNAAKHSLTSQVDASVKAEGDVLRVTVTNSRNQTPEEKMPSAQLGLAFLKEITTNIQLEVNHESTTLLADIPFKKRF